MRARHQTPSANARPFLPRSTMPKSEKKDKPRILRSAGYWKDFHASKAARATRVAPPNWNASVQHPLSDAELITTFVPGRSRPIVRVANMPTPQPASSENTGPITTRQKPFYTPTRGSNSILACREHDDERLLAALSASSKRTADAGALPGAPAKGAAALQQLVRARATYHARMARKGILGEPAETFVNMSDDEVKAWLKTPHGREKLKAATLAGEAARDKILAGEAL
ncbi:hypothetical protein B0H11DRAFT_1915647 [Mycena galericulata]|nr:hypothetical protein B0H11DRAFT_1915647 [Mycena galericulata]